MRSRNIGYIPQVDHLRLLAALAVFGFHYFHYTRGSWTPVPDKPWAALVTEGHTGVGLFFVLSGFILTAIALCGGPVDYRQFLRNRLLRIAPLYLVFFVVAISIGRDSFRAADLLYLLTSNIGKPPTSEHFMTGAAWSVSVEFSFYLVFPFLLRFTRETGPSYLLGLMILLFIMKVGAFLATPNGTLTLYSTLVGRFDQFLLGMLAAVLWVERRAALERWGRPLLAGSTLLVLLALGVQARHASFLLPAPKQAFWIGWPTVEGAVWALFLLGYLAAALRLPPALDRALARGGTWSFSLYLWHPVIIFIATALAPLPPTAGLAVRAVHAAALLAITLAVSSLSYATIERPFLSLRRRYVTDPVA